jgi:hypothetical protein
MRRKRTLQSCLDGPNQTVVREWNAARQNSLRSRKVLHFVTLLPVQVAEIMPPLEEVKRMSTSAAVGGDVTMAGMRRADAGDFVSSANTVWRHHFSRTPECAVHRGMMHPHPMRRLQRIPKFVERDIGVLAHQFDQKIDEP